MTIDFIKDTYHDYLGEYRNSQGLHILDDYEFFRFIAAISAERYNEFLKEFNRVDLIINPAGFDTL